MYYIKDKSKQGQRMFSKISEVHSAYHVCAFTHTALKRCRDHYVPLIRDERLGVLLNDALVRIDAIIRYLDTRLEG